MKKIFSLLLVITMLLSLCACGKESHSSSKLVGEWTITELNIEPQYSFITNRNDTVNQLVEAFPEINTTVEFTQDKYDDGYKMISSSNIASYSLMSNKRISIGDVVGTYRMNGNSLVIEFEDIVTVTLKK